jgi:exosome complex RNA-binding protein Rrp42 (RNase PH superfamily)
MLLSRAEQLFIREGIDMNIRSDGRERHDIRYFSVATNILPHTTSSVRCKLGNTDVMAVISVELTTPTNEFTASLGDLHIHVNSYRSSYAGSSDANVDDTDVADINTGLAAELRAMYSNALNLHELCVIPSESVWCIHADCHVYHSDGNTLLALTLALTAALHLTTLPAVHVIDNVHTGEKEIELIDDQQQNKHLDCSRLPIAVTFYCIDGRHYDVLDCDGMEEMCSTSTTTYGVTSRGSILTQSSSVNKHSSIMKLSNTGMNSNSVTVISPHEIGISLSSTGELRVLAKGIGKELHEQLQNMLNENVIHDTVMK